ncbi:hypothetical protein KVR01_011229 [Diaporthe batatas]|uniref:uncharacterized protein n=1 Tax=Diaporthe batatas TaxID=748121 RepID=UPI001D03C3C8|nr:uncharacterized protein KVR01_011229 [Diaporthe batatas]KAG8158786.1 hypothetical protein KVR01_011229 [Diaporthe batatas]
MGVAELQTEALSQLRSQDQLNLLDSIDELRSEGIDYYVSLPQIIVCGDQSAGKSSVLEAISGVSFPVQSKTCTRFPTELILRRTPEVSSSVSIVPDASRTEEEKRSLAAMSRELGGLDGLGEVIEAAKDAMGIKEFGKTFSRDLLRIEITGPERSHLTIVDLPGLIHFPTKSQTDDDVGMIKDVVKKYMKESRSVILAVVSAKNEIENQIVLDMVREADPAGQRTMGIITKPDRLKPGSPSEKFFVSLAQNKEVPELRLGWHVLLNLDSEEESFSLSKRNLKEDEFFSKGSWLHVPSHLLGIANLKPRLSDVLMKQIYSELPSVVQEIESKLEDCRKNLELMGPRRESKDEQQKYLLGVSMDFQKLVKAAIDGVYNDAFFEGALSDRGYSQRLRAVVQNSNQEFSKHLLVHGSYRYIVKEINGDVYLADLERLQVTRDEFITHIQTLMSRTRGRELPGTFSPMIVEELFREQCCLWKGILSGHVRTVARAARMLLTLASEHIADGATSQHIMREIIEPDLERIIKDMELKANELMEPHRQWHPVTYNHYFTETIQKVRNERREAHLRRVLASHLGISQSDMGSSASYVQCTVNGPALIKALANDDEPDMDRFAASQALDCLEAYYKVALKRFIDDVAVELVEGKLLKALPEIFSPITVLSLPPEVVDRVAGESGDNVRRRGQLEKQLDVLSKGSEVCKRFAGMELIDVIVNGTRALASVSEPVSDDDMTNGHEPLPEEAPANEVMSLPSDHVLGYTGHTVNSDGPTFRSKKKKKKMFDFA